MWFEEAVFYQIYPLGFCGAPFENPCAPGTPVDEIYGAVDGVSPIMKVKEWIPHFTKLGINAIYFSPVFESDTHGYNTRDYGLIDRRLGTNEDFKEVVDALHEAGIKVVLDGVFNHVGRGFFAFQDVLQKRWDSPYKDWFHISFDGNSNYNDGLWYEGWEGNFDLVKLNLRHPDVIGHILDKVSFWIDYFGIDGLRLDVAYCLDHDFLRRLREHTEWKKPEFLLLGEVLHGEYGRMLREMSLHSLTNYQCYKGIHSAFNSGNMFEIMHSLMRLFGPEDWTVCRGAHLLSFADNHDVTRLASIINNPNHLPLVYTMVYTMPGIPCVYYGSEWGTKARKEEGDPALRACFPEPQWNELTDVIAKLSEIKKNSPALNYGSLRNVVLTNHQCIFERKVDGQRILVAINSGDYEYHAHFDAGCGRARELLTDTDHDFGGGSVLPPYSAKIWLMEN